MFGRRPSTSVCPVIGAATIAAVLIVAPFGQFSASAQALGNSAPAQTISAAQAESFVRCYQAAWAAHDADSLGALWHPDGVLHDPLYDRDLAGREIAALTKGQFARNPGLTWTLLGWTARGDILVLEFQNDFLVNGKPFKWRGVDKLRLRGGRIVEETVYVDTAPLRALRDGKALEPLARLPKAPD